MVIEQLGEGTVKVTVSREELLIFGVDFDTMEAADEDTRLLILEILRLSRAREMLASGRLFVEAFAREDGSCLLYVSAAAVRRKELCCITESLEALLGLCGVEAVRKKASTALYTAGGKYCLRLMAASENAEALRAVLSEFGRVAQSVPQGARELIPSDAAELISGLHTE